MLKNMGQVIRNITDQRRSHSVNAMGQLKAGMKLVHYFDEETLEFISKYFRKGIKRGWLEQSCLISFRSSGKHKEMVLFASLLKRSKIDLTTFPNSFLNELDQSWRSICSSKKRDSIAVEETLSLQTPSKVTCRRESITPIEKQTNISNEMSLVPIQPPLRTLESFGYLPSILIKTGLQKSIEKAIKKREIYLRSISQLKPDIRSNKIKAMKYSLKESIEQKECYIQIIKKLKKDITIVHNVDMCEDDPMLSYIIDNNDTLRSSLSTSQSRSIRIKLLTVRDLLILLVNKYDNKMKILLDTLSALQSPNKDLYGIDSIILNYEEYIQTWRQQLSIPNLIMNVISIPQQVLHYYNGIMNSRRIILKVFISINVGYINENFSSINIL